MTKFLLSFLGVVRNSWDWLFCTPGSKKIGSSSAWHVFPRYLSDGAYVLSAGVGHDISFEKELLNLFDVRMDIFDPSNTGVKTMAKKENRILAKKVRFHKKGLSANSGVVTFALPIDAAEGSFHVPTSADVAAKRTVSFSCVSVSDFCRQKKISRIDLLKMDIEGSEYGVLADVLFAMRGRKLFVKQICVEFHHFQTLFGRLRTIPLLFKMYSAGFRLRYKAMCDYTFVNVDEN
jgi:FkbM family methyltransferase